MGDPHPDLKLGIIGLSEGNGHPYSWSAICNGYNPAEMDRCGFPAIPEYLSKRAFPDDQLHGATVSHVWTQDRDVSEQVARASLIPCVCDDPSEMLNEVDGVLLARDDSENHEHFAGPFLRAGVPVYIDKPFALDQGRASRLLGLAKEPWGIFSCSALYYASELLPEREAERIGQIESIHAITPKGWRTYGVHVVEPVMRILGDPGVVNMRQRAIRGKATHLWMGWEEGPLVHFEATGRANSPIRFHFVGSSGEALTCFSDSFAAFRSALEAFVVQIRAKRLTIPRDHLRRVVSILEAGDASNNMT